jgi:hypothetical protein
MLRHSYYDKDEMRVVDRKVINLGEYYDVEYWAKRFGITPELLNIAVKEAGSTVAEEVEMYVRKKYPA